MSGWHATHKFPSAALCFSGKFTSAREEGDTSWKSVGKADVYDVEPTTRTQRSRSRSCNNRKTMQPRSPTRPSSLGSRKPFKQRFRPRARCIGCVRREASTAAAWHTTLKFRTALLTSFLAVYAAAQRGEQLQGAGYRSLP